MHRRITPTARGHLDWINKTYAIGDQVASWTKEIAETAHGKSRPPTELPLSDALDELRDVVGCSASDAALAMKRFGEAGLIRKIKLIKAAIARRTSPVVLRVNQKSFSALSDGRFQVDIQLVYEIDFAWPAVTFYSFQHFSAVPAEVDGEVNNVAEKWQ